jgi:hypothetical protein
MTGASGIITCRLLETGPDDVVLQMARLHVGGHAGCLDNLQVVEKHEIGGRATMVVEEGVAPGGVIARELR